MKIYSILACSLLFTLQQLSGQVIQRKDAADAINFIDSLPNPLKPSANNLVAYFQKIKPLASKTNNYILPLNKIDSLKQYYSILLEAYNNAIKMATQNKTIDKFAGLKSKFLNLLIEGRKPWMTVIPVHIKMFTKGRNALNSIEQNQIDKTSSTFMTSETKALEWAKIVATQEDEIEKKYHLELHGDLYK